MLGSGSFGIAYRAQVVETGKSVAIKKVYQGKRYENRVLQIMKELRHPNVVELKHAFLHLREEARRDLPERGHGVLSGAPSRVIRVYSRSCVTAGV